MNPFDFPPIAALLAAAADLLATLGTIVTPAGAIVVVTLAVRALLIPVGVSVARAAQNRRRLAPKLAELQRRHKRNPEKLQRATMELYTAEKVSPFAGCLPMLAQAPVLALVYALFAYPTLAGEPNHLLNGELFGAGLGRHLADIVTGVEVSDVVFLALSLVLGVVAWFNRRLMIADAPAPAPETPAVPGAAFMNPRGPLGWAPFAVLIAVAIVPLAASLYLAVSGVWSYLERRILRAVYP